MIKKLEDNSHFNFKTYPTVYSKHKKAIPGVNKVFSFLQKRAQHSFRKNFFISFSILLPVYSIFCFFFMIQGIGSLHLKSLWDLLCAYCFFIFMIPGLFAANHSMIFAMIVQIFKCVLGSETKNFSSTERQKGGVTDFLNNDLNLKEENNMDNSTTYHKNELKLNHLFKK